MNFFTAYLRNRKQPQWQLGKKIVTESSDNTIAQDTTGNAATATELSDAVTLQLTGEVTGSVTNDFTAGDTISIAATVANLLEVSNFIDAAVVTGTEVNSTAFAATGATPSGDTMLATTSAVIEYINDQDLELVVVTLNRLRSRVVMALSLVHQGHRPR